MNKEVPLKERIEKLYESGYVNEFNYLESQLQEARYLVTILHKQTEEKDKEIEKLNNIIEETINLLEPFVEIDMCIINGKMIKPALDKLKALKEDDNND